MAGNKAARVDRHLLMTLQTLLTEKSISRTAELLGQSPPAVSLALRRLRELLKDPLLVRSGAKMVLTERGERILQLVIEAVESVNRVFLADGPFDPLTATFTLNVGAANSMAALLVPPLVERLRREAPNVNLVVRAIDPLFDYQKALEDGALDLVIGDWPNSPEALHMSPLLEDELCCILRTGHPEANSAGISLETYLQLNHLSPTPTSPTYLGPIGTRLAELGLKRRIAVTIPEYNMIPLILLRSDLVFTTARCFCESWAKIAPLTVVPAPEIFQTIRFCLLWHNRAHMSTHGQWIRSILQSLADDLINTKPEDARKSRGIIYFDKDSLSPLPVS